MLDKEELEELKFFSDKVARVHGPDHNEYIKINEIVKNIENIPLEDIIYEELRDITNDYKIPEGACKATTVLLKLLGKMDNK